MIQPDLPLKSMETRLGQGWDLVVMGAIMTTAVAAELKEKLAASG